MLDNIHQDANSRMDAAVNHTQNELNKIRTGRANPEIFDSIVPDYLGFPRFWTIASGVLEIILGIGMILPVYRQLAARYFTVFLVFV